jgi:hypothetical protein
MLMTTARYVDSLQCGCSVDNFSHSQMIVLLECALRGMQVELVFVFVFVRFDIDIPQGHVWARGTRVVAQVIVLLRCECLYELCEYALH